MNTQSTSADVTMTEEAKKRATDCDNCSMLNTAPRIDRHVILCHSSDWPARIEEEEGSFAAEICRLFEIAQNTSNLAVKLTACDEETYRDEEDTGEDKIDLIVYPEAVRLSVCLEQLQLFVDAVMSDNFVEMASSCGLVVRSLNWEKLILVCIHAARDKVCQNLMFFDIYYN